MDLEDEHFDFSLTLIEHQAFCSPDEDEAEVVP